MNFFKDEEYAITGISKRKELVMRPITKNENCQKEMIKIYDNVTDYIEDYDAVSLYASAMANYEFPTGTTYWSDDLDEVKKALNNGDTSFPLGIVECVVEFDNPGYIVCPLLSFASHK
jgi:hypothetical protein